VAVRRRDSTTTDADQAVIYSAREAGLEVALRFSQAIEAAYRSISETPGAGSARYAEMLNVDGLRSRPLARFPYQILYLHRGGQVEAVRVLHSKSDISALLSHESF
jgi:toxin ParE1/3/4